MRFIIHISVLLFFTTNCTGQNQDNSVLSGKEFEKEYIKQLLYKVHDYQQKHTGWTDDRNWERATYYTGVMAFYNATKDEKILDQAIIWAESHDWKHQFIAHFPIMAFSPYSGSSHNMG